MQTKWQELQLQIIDQAGTPAPGIKGNMSQEIYQRDLSMELVIHTSLPANLCLRDELVSFRQKGIFAQILLFFFFSLHV